MNLAKEIWIEEFDKIMADAEENGTPMDDTKAGDLASERTRDRFADMVDAAKDRAKYGN